MLVKRTKTGFSLMLDWQYRSEIHTSLKSLLIAPRVKFSTADNIKEAACHYVLLHLLQRKHFQLDCADTVRLSVTYAEAIALIWHLRKHDDSMRLVYLKSEIHKQLS